MKKLKELSFDELKELNTVFDAEHKFSEEEVILLNNLRLNFPERIGKHETPQILDVIEFTDEYGNHFSNSMVLSYSDDKKNIVVFQHPHIPFVSLSDKKEQFSYSCGGGAEVNLSINNLVCVGTKEVLIQQFSKRCFHPAYSSVMVPVRVNLWNLKNPINKYGDYSTKNYSKYYIYFHKEFEDGYASDFLRGVYFSTKKDYLKWLKETLAIEFVEEEIQSAVVFTYRTNSHYYRKDCPYSGSIEEFEKIEENLKKKRYNYEISIIDDCEYKTKKVINHTKHVITEHKFCKNRL